MGDKRIELASLLTAKDPSKLNMVIGFDGFVDEIIHVVDKRLDPDHFTRVETIGDLAGRIEKASGLSTNIELISTLKKIGGNGPIMCNALSINKPKVSYIGALGYPTIDDVFAEMKETVDLYTIATNGHTDALEFNDGKLMFGKMTTLNDVTYERLIEVVGKDHLVDLLGQADLFATVNWSMLPNMTDLYRKLLLNIIPLLPKKSAKPYMFIDLADPEKRENVEIKELLDLLQQFNQYYFVVLGLNKKEAYDVADVLDLFDSSSLQKMQVSLEDLNQSLFDYLNIDAVVIHPVDRSCCVVDGVFYEEMGPYITKPKLSTGAGDNFNAGFMLGMLLGLQPDQALLTGMSTSGFYVRNARSPQFKELYAFMQEWANGLKD